MATEMDRSRAADSTETVAARRQSADAADRSHRPDEPRHPDARGADQRTTGADGTDTRETAGGKPNRVVAAGVWSSRLLSVVCVIAAGLVALFALSVPRADRLPAAAVLAAVGGAAVVTGGLLGFLFAIPRFGTSIGDRRYVPNTNLEQVSDWVTKTLVGIGLIQARAIGQLFAALMRQASRSIDGTTSHAVVIGAVAVFALLPGFIVGYIKSRVALPMWFLSADQIADGDEAALEHGGASAGTRNRTAAPDAA